MKTGTKGLAIVVALTLFGLAQAASPQVTANIPFKFMLAGKEMPAGTYTFEQMTGSRTVKVTETQTKKSVMVPIVTTISNPPGVSTVVFDKDGDVSYLSELHIPGADGLLFAGAMNQHSHVSVPASQ